MRQLKYNRKGYKTHFISGANSYMFRHQGAITRKFINNEGSYVQQVFKALFALISTLRVTSLKMLQLHITHQHTVATTTTTTTTKQQQQNNNNNNNNNTAIRLLSHTITAVFSSWAVHTNDPINIRSKGISF